MTGQQICEEILKYLQDKTYNYAVLIDGEWGSGKTYFVKTDLQTAIKKTESYSDNPKEIKYISLYGCSGVVDVQERLVLSLAERIGTKVARQARWGEEEEQKLNKATRSVGILGRVFLNKKVSDVAPVYNVAFDWINISSYIFVFDDLERCDCPLNEVMGFINELVEHENAKVILVANEKEISGIAEPQYLELQYGLALDDRIEWPREEENLLLGRKREEKKKLSIGEIELRRGKLFPPRESNGSYRKVREKVVGVAFRYEPEMREIIINVMDKSCADELKSALSPFAESFVSEMKRYNHNNIRTFQFFLSRVECIIKTLENMSLDNELYERACERVIIASFRHAVEYKSNYKSPTEKDSIWSRGERETLFQSVREYMETGTFDGRQFQQEVMSLLEVLRANIPQDDPYNLLYQQYFLNTQVWCEEQIDKMLVRLGENKYPVSIYDKIIIVVQRLLDLGFDEEYMSRVKTIMLNNISSFKNDKLIDDDLWYMDDPVFKGKVYAVIEDINDAIKTHSKTVRKKSTKELLRKDNWVAELKAYTNPNGERYLDDVPIFSQAPSEAWINALEKSSPSQIYEFRMWLSCMYPDNASRRTYKEDENTLADIYNRFNDSKEEDLIKRAALGWLCCQLERISLVNNEDGRYITRE